MKLADAANLSLPGRIAAAAVLSLFGISSIVWAYSSSRAGAPRVSHVQNPVERETSRVQDSQSSTQPASPPSTEALKLDINTATQAELELLPGVGPALSRRIAEYRHEHRPFEKLEDLDKVAGIGPKMLEKIRPFVQVGPLPIR